VAGKGRAETPPAPTMSSSDSISAYQNEAVWPFAITRMSSASSSQPLIRAVFDCDDVHGHAAASLLSPIGTANRCRKRLADGP
jgi:hypothetical protein